MGKLTPEQKRQIKAQYLQLKESGQWNPDNMKKLMAVGDAWAAGEAAPELPTMKQEGPGVLGTIGEGLSRGLDYAGGLTRTSLATSPAVQAARALLGEGGDGKFSERLANLNRTSLDDQIRALQGKAPQTAEYLERAGVPEGGSLSELAPALYSDSGEGLALQRGGAFDPTARGAAGFVGDTLLDPTTYMTGGSTAALKNSGKIGKAAAILMNPVEALGRGTAATGKAMYKSGFKKIDEVGSRFGKRDFSDLMFDQGIWGRTKSVAKKVDKRVNDLIEQKVGILDQADELGATVDLNGAFDEAQKIIDRYRVTKPEVATRAQGLLDQYKLPDGTYRTLGIRDADEVKQYIGELAKTSAYDTVKKTTSGQGVLKATGGGLKKSIEDSADMISAGGLGGKLKNTNEELGVYLTTRPALESQESRANTLNLLTSVDGWLAGLGEPNVAAMKKLGDLSKTTVFRTGAGLGVNKVGKAIQAAAPLAEGPLLRRSLIEATDRTNDPMLWQAIHEYEQSKGKK